jgi:hypothetical protein
MFNRNNVPIVRYASEPHFLAGFRPKKLSTPKACRLYILPPNMQVICQQDRFLQSDGGREKLRLIRCTVPGPALLIGEIFGAFISA